jgi:hypothetical protein
MDWNQNGAIRFSRASFRGENMNVGRRNTQKQGLARRWKTFLPVRLERGDGAARGHILNLSVGGALVHSSVAHEPGTIVRVTLGDFHISGRVAWRRGDRFGLTFLTEIPVFSLARVLDPPCATARVLEMQG